MKSWREDAGDYQNPSSEDYINPELRAYLDRLDREEELKEKNNAAKEADRG